MSAYPSIPPAQPQANTLALRVIDLGRMAYAPALEVQRRVHEEVLQGAAPQMVLLVEHDPVITVSQRKTASQHLVARPALLAKLGIDVQPTDRGGDITYHGPGQLVVYPILRLSAFGLHVGGYMRLLEQVVIDAMATFGVAGKREQGATGVWVSCPVSNAQCPMSQAPAMTCDIGPGTLDIGQIPAKIAAMGVRVRRNVTLHGLALNVSTDLSHFATIVPCGLAGRPVTSLRELLGEAAPSLEQVKAALLEALGRQLSAHTRGRSVELLRQAPHP